MNMKREMPGYYTGTVKSTFNNVQGIFPCVVERQNSPSLWKWYINYTSAGDSSPLRSNGTLFYTLKSAKMSLALFANQGINGGKWGKT